MAWVRFTGEFFWDPPEHKGRTTLGFRPGAVLSVRADCAKAAVAAGKAVKVKAPARDEDPPE